MTAPEVLRGLDGSSVEALLEVVQDAVIIIDCLGQVLRFNPAAEAMFGYESYELLGRSIGALMETDERARHDSHMSRYLRGGQASILNRRREVRARHRSGRIFPVDLWVTEAGSGADRVFIGVLRDLSAKNAAELSARTRELDRSNQRLERFARAASNDLRQPLASIRSLARWIEEDASDDIGPAGHEHFRRLQSRISRMERLLDDMLESGVNGYAAHLPTEVDVQELVGDVVAQIDMPDGLLLRTEGDLPRLVTARVQLQRALHHLVDNAIQHHDDPHRGVVTIAARRVGGFYEFSVRDNGPGFPSDVAGSLERAGAGRFGLSFVQALVQSAGGQVRLHPSAGPRGSTLSFSWPVEWPKL